MESVKGVRLTVGRRFDFIKVICTHNLIKVCWFPLILAYLSLGCQTDRKKERQRLGNHHTQSPKTLTFEIVKEVRIPADSGQYVFYTSNTKIIDENSFYYGIDVNSTLRIYDLHAEKEVKTIDLSSDPTTSFGEIAEAYLHTFDSIFLLSPYESKISLIDTAGNLKGQMILRKEVENSNLQSFESGENGNHFSYSSYYNHLILFGYGNYNPFTDWKYYDQPFNFRLDLADTTLITFGEYPEIYRAKKSGVPGIDEEIFSLSTNKGFFHSFSRSPIIQKIDFEPIRSTKMYQIESRFFTKTGTYERKEDYNVMMKSYISEPYFLNFLWDETNEVFYRIAKHHINYKTADGKVALQTDAEWSVIVCDKDLNVIGETKMPSRKYNFNYTFITSEGLMVGKDSPSNENDQENIIEFDILRFDV